MIRPALLALAVAGMALTACREPEIDAEKDPVKKAQIMCRHTIEETRLADRDQLGGDGVLRKHVATFAEPTIVKSGARVTFDWPAGAIVKDRTGERHAATCEVDPTARHIYTATFDGEPMQSNYGY